MGFKIPKGLDFQVQELDFVADNSARTVSYTHLTLPTKLEV